mmetsp:Transcript_52840/g.78952  ORF Transcript_52840/g.78952 Transcript_52840/m.78952 type:complete len:99 (-) Transcript_52840:1723-2019(-)
MPPSERLVVFLLRRLASEHAPHGFLTETEVGPKSHQHIRTPVAVAIFIDAGSNMIQVLVHGTCYFHSSTGRSAWSTSSHETPLGASSLSHHIDEGGCR